MGHNSFCTIMAHYSFIIIYYLFLLQEQDPRLCKFVYIMCFWNKDILISFFPTNQTNAAFTQDTTAELWTQSFLLTSTAQERYCSEQSGIIPALQCQLCTETNGEHNA